MKSPGLSRYSRNASSFSLHGEKEMSIGNGTFPMKEEPIMETESEKEEKIVTLEPQEGDSQLS